MNKLASHFISTMQGLFGLPGGAAERSSIQIEDIRQMMLDTLGQEGCYSFPNIERRILFAPDLQGLWYLRSEIMVALSKLQGEVVASDKIQRITNMFEGLLPRSMMSRPGSLRRF